MDLSDPCNYSSDILKNLWEQLFDLIALKYRQNPLNYPILSSHGDPLGTLYEFFLRNQLQFEESERKVIIQKRNQKKQGFGTVYTPFEIVHMIVQHLLTKILTHPIRKRYRIADIACGTGRFLGEWQALAGDSCNCDFSGYDIDNKALEIAKSALPFPNAHWFHQDILLNEMIESNRHFDFILGNPPYIESRAIPDKYWEQIKKNYQTAYKKFDLSVVFLEKIVTLLRPGGWAGIIVSNKWLVSDYGEKIRRLLLTDTYIESIVDISHLPVFHGISTYPVILFFQKLRSPIGHSKTTAIFHPQSLTGLSRVFSEANQIEISQEYFLKLPKHLILTNISPQSLQLLTHLNDLLNNDKAFRLGSPFSPYTLRKGIHTGNIKSKLFIHSPSTTPPADDSTYKQAITSRQKVERYKISWEGLWVHYQEGIIQKSAGDYGSLREPWIFEANPKIVIKLFGTTLQAALDTQQYYANNSLILLIPRPHDAGPLILSKGATFENTLEEFYYLLGVLNSKLISEYYSTLFSATHVRGDYLQYYIKDLNQIPLMRVTQGTIKKMKDIAALSQKLETAYTISSLSTIETDSLEKELNIRVENLYELPE
jgi:SAM-dependent methyltransferase